MTENHDIVVSTSTPVSSSNLSPLPFFSNPDILEEICEHLAYPDLPYDDDEYRPFLQTFDIDIRTSRQSLRDAALTCKAFLKPALDRLWRSLDTLFPLLKTLPVFVLSDTTYVIRGKMEEKDWERFDFYAPRVRKFKYTRDSEQLDIAMHVYFRLAQLRPNPLLPALQHLVCPSVKQKDYLVPGIFLFLGPAIQTIELRGISSIEDKLTGTVLHTLFAENARVGTLVLNGHGLSNDTITLATKFQHLHTLEIRGIHPKMDINVIREVAALPWLTDLKIDLEGPGITADTFAGHHDMGLRDLKKLRVSGSLDTIKAFLSCVSSTELVNLKIAMINPQNGPLKQHLLETLLSNITQYWKDSLAKVAIVQQRANERDSPLLEIEPYTLLPLTQASGLRYLKFEGFTLELTDEDLYSYLEGWPQLKKLALPPAPAANANYRPETPTLASLHRIAFLCPRLQFLCMPLSIERVEVPQGPNPWSPHGLRTLIIAGGGEVNMEDPTPPAPVLVIQPPQPNAAGPQPAQAQPGFALGFNPVQPGNPPLPVPVVGGGGGNHANGQAAAPLPNGGVGAAPGANLLFAQAAVMPAPPPPLGAPNVGNTRSQWDLQDLLNVARHIDKAFPSVKWIEGSDSRNRDRWRQVRDVVRMYQELRGDAVLQERFTRDASKDD
ncbi:hypothetical protein CVT24_005564 [Panaeolus cyanescens]|uniref:F-box domain-containing protein n=1 Tax=Panaeolus cyanescens TaxID=181874 RepID=A0A409VQE7_9AGAR|nr:hypothetical protein CVT24_005564 [Panaeolus cyanescens]